MRDLYTTEDEDAEQSFNENEIEDATREVIDQATKPERALLKQGVRAAVNEIKQKLSSEAIAVAKLYGIFLFIVIGIIVIMYGAVCYLEDKTNDYLFSQVHDDEFFESKYDTEAQHYHNLIETDSIRLANDMPMLSKSDILNIFEHIEDYDSDIAFKPLIAAQYYTTSANVTTKTNIIADLATSINANETNHEELVTGWDKTSALFGGGDYTNYILSYQSLYNNEEQLASASPEGISEYFDGSFQIHWRTVLALCEMMSEYNQMHPETFTYDGWSVYGGGHLYDDVEFSTNMDGYYISDAQIERICNLFDFQFSCYPDDELGRDYVEIGMYDEANGTLDNAIMTGIEFDKGFLPKGVKTARYYTIDEITKWTYRLTTVTMPDGTEEEKLSYIMDANRNYVGEWERKFTWDAYLYNDSLDAYAPTIDLKGLVNTKGAEYVRGLRAFNSLRVPSLAPDRVYNSYINIDYKYEPITDGTEKGADRCYEAVVTINAATFYDKIREVIPTFEWEHFINLLGVLCENKNNEKAERELATWKAIKSLYEQGTDIRKRYDIEQNSPTYMQTVSGEDVIIASQRVFTLTNFSGCGVYIGADSIARNSIGYDYNHSTDYIYIGTHIPFEGRVNDKAESYNNFINISPQARAAVNKSDELTKAEIATMLQKMYEQLSARGNDTNNANYMSDFSQTSGSISLLWNIQETDSLVNDIYNWQLQHPDVSVSAVLASFMVVTPHLIESNYLEDLNKVAQASGNPDLMIEVNYGTEKDKKGNENQSEEGEEGEKKVTDEIYNYYKFALSYKDEGVYNFIWDPAYYKTIDQDFKKALIKYMDSSPITLYTDKCTSLFDMEFAPEYNVTIQSQSEYDAAEKAYMLDAEGYFKYFVPWWKDMYTVRNNGTYNIVSNGSLNGSVATITGCPAWCNQVAEQREILLNSIGKTSGGRYTWPVKSSTHNVNSAFGAWINEYNTAYARAHGGIDIYGAKGMDVLAATSGEVVRIGSDGATSYGHYITIRNDDGNYAIYGHMANYFTESDGTGYLCAGTVYLPGAQYSLDKYADKRYHPSETYANLKVGDRVTAGQVIGIVGNTGSSQGAHLHFQLNSIDSPVSCYVDPAPYLGLTDEQLGLFYKTNNDGGIRIRYIQYYNNYYNSDWSKWYNPDRFTADHGCSPWKYEPYLEPVGN